MKFSIITINYNDKRGLEKTLKSLQSQTFRDYEHIVIDGGSTDGSVEVIERYAANIAYWVSEPDRGIYNALNKGLKHVHGEYVNCMNSGDMFATPYVLQQIVDEKIPEQTGIIYGDTIFAEPDGRQTYQVPDPFWQSREYIHGMGICHQSIYVRRDLAQSHPYDEHMYRILADFDAIQRIYSEGASTYYIPKPFTIFDRCGLSSTHYKEGWREMGLITHRYATPKYWFLFLRKFYYYRLEWAVKSRWGRMWNGLTGCRKGDS
jgi:glycosyltransferase involved in cell wall biosynthesis